MERKRAKTEREVPRQTIDVFEDEDPITVFEEGDSHKQLGNRKYKYTITIDDREICPGVDSYISERAKKDNLDVTIKRKRLVLNDYLFCVDGHAVAIRERKRIDDFYQSLVSNRYAEQRDRMKDSGIPLQGYVFTRTASEKEDKKVFLDVLFGNSDDSSVETLKNFIDTQYHVIPKHTRYDTATKERVVMTDSELQSYYTAMVKMRGTELVSDEFLPQYLYGVLKEVVEYVKFKDITTLPPRLYIEQKMGKRKIVDAQLFLQAALQTFCPDSVSQFLVTKYKSIVELQDELRKNNDELHLNKLYKNFINRTDSKKIYQFLV